MVRTEPVQLDCQVPPLNEALDDLLAIEANLFGADPRSRAALAAAQLRLILTRIAHGIPPGRASLENLIALVAGASGHAHQLGEVLR